MQSPGLTSRTVHPEINIRRRAGAARLALSASLFVLGACARVDTAPEPAPATQAARPHAAPVTRVTTTAPIPPLVTQAAHLPPPSAGAVRERYSVVVNDVPVRELLFALARDASLELDVSGPLEGRVTLNAVEQPLSDILARVTRQCGLQYTLEGAHLLVGPDLPFFRNYDVDYVNLVRDTESNVNVATRISTTGQGGSAGRSGGGDAAQATNTSGTRVSSHATNHFWQTLAANILGILGKPGTGQDGTSDPDVVVNAEAGMISVRATARQHALIQSFVRQVTANARRQVLIEATIVEVTLSDEYQAGVDWRLLTREGKAGFSIDQDLLGAITDGVVDNAVSAFTLGYRDADASGQRLEATVRLLSEFGETRVLSSPRLMVVNNQTALLKVVEELVYFTLDVTTTDATANAQGRSFVETEVHSVPVGLVMAVTPQIAANAEITLTVRPTISQKIGDAVDPGPQLASQLNGIDVARITNTVPVIRTREMESVLKLVNGEIGVLGGLMQDELRTGRREVPGLARLPWIGKTFFDADERGSRKTELVIFLRPIIIGQETLALDTAGGQVQGP